MKHMTGITSSRPETGRASFFAFNSAARFTDALRFYFYYFAHMPAAICRN